MKSRKILILGLLLTLALSGCGKKDKEENILDVDTEVSEIEIATPTPEKVITHEDTEAFKLFEEEKSNLNEYKVYYASGSSYVLNSVYQYTDENITLDFICRDFAKSKGIDPITINSFEFTPPEPITSYKNGVASVDYADEFIAYLDINDSLQRYIDSQVTPLSEWYELYSFIDTACTQIGCEGIVLTTNGAPFHTLRYTWKEDEPIYFSTKLADFLDKLSSDEIEFSKMIETYRDLGYNITRENYLSFLNSNITESDLEKLDMVTDEEEVVPEEIEDDEVFEDTSEEIIDSAEEIEESEDLTVIGG